ncbi:hypothetical protein ACHAXT_004319 [Thalassiosira profunda]
MPCDLVAVEWNQGGLQLSITAVGIWSYQREVVEPPRKGKDSNNHPTTELICVGYGTTPQTQSVNTEGFFPSSKILQIYSILGPSLYFAAILTMTVFAMATLFSLEASDRDSATSAAAAAVAAVLLLSSGIFQLLSVHGLMHHSDKICNEYSRCSLSGVGGHWAIVGIFCAFFVCGLASCFAANVGCRNRKRRGDDVVA